MAWMLYAMDANQIKIEQDKRTAIALAEAKMALLGYAASVSLADAGRPGDLPCPDTDNDGIANTPCAGNAIGRLPWKSLGIIDLRDANRERLWYAVSEGFKNSPRIGLLNSDSLGSITVRDNAGNLVNDGSLTTGAVAIVIAPGAPLVRQDGVVQIRDLPNENTPSNYLDVVLGEDNQNFDNGGLNGFIHGPVRDANRNIILNDKLLMLSREDLLRVMEKRVASEALRCLEAYAAVPANGGKYPWPAKLDIAALSFQDVSGQLLGRLPDTPFTQTKADNAAMKDSWQGACEIISNAGWWPNWKEMVFYGLADEFKPTGDAAGCGTCLTVNPPSANADKRVSILVAGKMMVGKSRASTEDKGVLANYLEAPNNLGGALFAQQPVSPVFNDVVVYK